MSDGNFGHEKFFVGCTVKVPDNEDVNDVYRKAMAWCQSKNAKQIQVFQNILKANGTITKEKRGVKVSS
jgi:hypothetical protein